MEKQLFLDLKVREKYQAELRDSRRARFVKQILAARARRELKNRWARQVVLAEQEMALAAAARGEQEMALAAARAKKAKSFWNRVKAFFTNQRKEKNENHD
jgi:hypothetical protein